MPGRIELPSTRKGALPLSYDVCWYKESALHRATHNDGQCIMYEGSHKSETRRESGERAIKREIPCGDQRCDKDVVQSDEPDEFIVMR